MTKRKYRVYDFENSAVLGQRFTVHEVLRNLGNGKCVTSFRYLADSMEEIAVKAAVRGIWLEDFEPDIWVIRGYGQARLGYDWLPEGGRVPWAI